MPWIPSEAAERKQMEAEWARKAEENLQIQAELESIRAHYTARIGRRTSEEVLAGARKPPSAELGDVEARRMPKHCRGRGAVYEIACFRARHSLALEWWHGESRHRGNLQCQAVVIASRTEA